MKKINNLLIIGGDNRQIYMADFFEKAGFGVTVYGMDDKKKKNITDIRNEIERADVIIFPLPASKDGKHISSIFPVKETYDDIIPKIKKDTLVFGGLIDKGIESKLKNRGIRYYDYFKREDVTIKNTVPTVQGILKAMIDNVDYTIHSSKCAVFGYGRIGKITADILKSIGADVTVCVRKDSDLANAGVKKLDSCLIKDFYLFSNQYDIIINTVPAPVIDRKVLENVKSDCLIIDVSSAPYGTDFAAAYEFGINAIQCPSLPGKVAPKTAGKIIAEAVISTLKEEEQWID